jgi:hypothetical protein
MGAICGRILYGAKFKTMSGQWIPGAVVLPTSDPNNPAPNPFLKSGPPRNFKRELTAKQVRAAHNRVSDKRFPTVNMYLDEFTKELNIELQKQE